MNNGAYFHEEISLEVSDEFVELSKGGSHFAQYFGYSGLINTSPPATSFKFQLPVYSNCE